MDRPGTLPPSGAKNYSMIDVGAKADTARLARASGIFRAKRETIQAIREGRIPKGNALALAEVAGIQAAKATASFLPLCHPLPLHAVRLWSETGEDSIRFWCEASTNGKTGVEMEALTGVSMALLCLYDLAKVIDPVLSFGDVHLERKEGGKSGIWVNPQYATAEPAPKARATDLKGARACVLTISDRCSRGEAKDESGAVLSDALRGLGASVVAEELVPDETSRIRRTFENWLERDRPAVVISTGGTGLSPRDVTFEAFEEFRTAHRGREIPGIGELLRSNGARHTPMAWLSRSRGIFVNDTLFVALPGSPKAVREGMDALSGLLPHLLHVHGGGQHVGAHQVR